MNAHTDDQPGRDLESRAALYRVVQTGAPLVNALDALTPEAAARIGLTEADRDRLSRIFGRALWASTADLHQLGEFDLAHQVTARAAELAEEKEGRQ